VVLPTFIFLEADEPIEKTGESFSVAPGVVVDVDPDVEAAEADVEANVEAESLSWCDVEAAEAKFCSLLLLSRF